MTIHTLEVLRDVAKSNNLELYLVGGYVRDGLLGKANYDLDVVARRATWYRLKKLLSLHGVVKNVKISKSSNQEDIVTKILLFRSHDGIDPAQITLPKRGQRQFAESKNTLSQDAFCRDFTINALYLPIYSKLSIENIIDKSTGLQDMKDGIIKSISDPYECLKASPIRMLRAITLSLRTNFIIAENLLDAIKDSVELLASIPKEQIKIELNKILLQDTPSRAFFMMHDLGILKYVLPVLDKCYGVSQDSKFHKYDVFQHCVYACDNTPPILTLRLAALLHDVGKLKARKKDVKKDRITFHLHEIFGAKAAKEALTTLKYDKDITKNIVYLVLNHMYHYTREFSDGAVRKLIRRIKFTTNYLNNIHEFPLFVLRSADRLGSGYKPVARTQRQLDLESRIKSLMVQDTAMGLKDLVVGGTELMETFGLPQGKIIGEILKTLLNKVLEDPALNNEKDLMHVALDEILEYKRVNLETENRS